MEHKFAPFVGFATLSAQSSLIELIAKHQIMPSIEVLTDAAKFGYQKAMTRFFPGLVKCPFDRNPIPEILLALRYQYESDPEGMFPHGSAPPPPAQEDSERARLSGRYKVAGTSLQRPAGASDSSVRRLGPSDSQVRGVPAGAGDAGVRRMVTIPPNPHARPAAGPSDSQVRPNGIAPVDLSKRNESSRYPAVPPARAAGDESSRGGVGATAADGDGPMKLRKIGPAPVFPWEKRRPNGR